MTTRFLPAFAVLAGALVACGGAADMAPAKSAPAREEATTPEPKTVQEAQDQIAEAAAELDGTGKADAAKSTTSATEPTSPAEPKPTARSGDACATPCRALASMKRAVDALCRMTGEGDDKCIDARKTLATNVGKTSSCRCAI